MNGMKAWTSMALGGLALAISASGGAAGPDQAFDDVLAARYRAVEAAIEARDGAAWFEALYDDSIVLAGEGSPATVRGRQALLPVIDEIVRTTRSCTLVPDAARDRSEGLAYSFVTYRCSPADASASDYQVRALFVWKEGAKGWRVVAETYVMGAM